MALKVENCSDEFLRGWLCAFLDGEGTVRKPRPGSHGLQFYNTDTALVDFCKEALDHFDIGYGEYTTDQKGPNGEQRKLRYTIVVQGLKHAAKFARLIGCVAPAKRKNLALTLNKFRNKRFRPISEATLHHMYWDQNLSLAKVAYVWYKSDAEHYVSRIRRRMNKFEIPYRTRSEAGKHQRV